MSDNKRTSDQLAESRLKLAGMQILPTKIKTEITFKESLKGAKRNFKIIDHFPCDKCPSLKPIKRTKCENCKGLGYLQVERFIDIDLPTNLSENQEVRFAGLGRRDAKSDKNADLIVQVSLAEHDSLKLSGNDITCTIALSIYDAVLGTEVKVPTATGKVVMKVHPLTPPGKIYRLKGLGIAGGDQLVTVEISMPQRLSDEQIILFRKLRELQDTSESSPKSLVFLG